MNSTATRCLILFGLLCATSLPLGAQDRTDLVERARLEFTDSASVELLFVAADPSSTPADSAWAVSVYELAGALLRMDDPAAAAVWLAWVARHGGDWPIDRGYFPPSVLGAYDAVVPTVSAAQVREVGTVATSWSWPSVYDRRATGTVEVAPSGATAPITVSIAGMGEAHLGEDLDLAPGTYEMVASADGYESANVTREVLPGATTILEFDLVPVFSADAQRRVAETLVRISPVGQAGPVCGNGYVATGDGLVLTTYGTVREMGAIQVTTADGTVYENAQIIVSDPVQDLAVIKLEGIGTSPLAGATGPRQGQYSWSVYHPGCGESTVALTRLEEVSANGPLRLSQQLVTAALGAPLLDRTGALIGLVQGPGNALPASRTVDLLERARADWDEQQLAAAGAFPWKWVGAGAAAAGALVATLSGGGGGGENPNPGTTGGIIVGFPDGWGR